MSEYNPRVSDLPPPPPRDRMSTNLRRAADLVASIHRPDAAPAERPTDGRYHGPRSGTDTVSVFEVEGRLVAARWPVDQRGMLDMRSIDRGEVDVRPVAAGLAEKIRETHGWASLDLTVSSDGRVSFINGTSLRNSTEARKMDLQRRVTRAADAANPRAAPRAEAQGGWQTRRTAEPTWSTTAPENYALDESGNRIFRRGEVLGMSDEEYAANADAINAQISGQMPKPSRR